MLLINSPQEDFKGHIDDGSMGGGGPIPYDNKIGFIIGDITVRNDYYNNPSYFSQNRNNIFHYCVIAHYKDEDPLRTYGETFADYCDYFVLFDQFIKDKSNNIGSVFMHELGHNFGLDHPSDDSDPKKKYTSMYSGISNIINYGTDTHARSYWGQIPNNNEWQWVQEHLDESLN